jgi:hypothetical protein
MKQTAVEWLIENSHIIPKNELNKRELIKQANKMFERQIIAAHGIKTKSINQDQSEIITGRQYYNQTFKQQAQ